MLDFRMYTFLSACRHMNFTHAASELHLTQPAVTQQIHWLERYYRTKLFSYNGKKLRLTGAGRLLRMAAKNVYHDDTVVKRQIEQFRTHSRSLLLGVTPTVSEHDIGGKLIEFLHRSGKKGISVRIDTTEELTKALEVGFLDFAVVDGPVEGDGIDSMAFHTERLILCCGKSYDIDKSIDLEELKRHKLLLCGSHLGSRRLFEQCLEEQRLTLESSFRYIDLGTDEIVKRFAYGNCGVAVVYEGVVHEDLRARRLRRIRVVGITGKDSFSLVWKESRMSREEIMRIYQGYSDCVC